MRAIDCVKFLTKRIACVEDMFRDSIMRGELKAFSGKAMTVMYNYNDDTFLKLAKKLDRIEEVADALNNSTVLDELRVSPFSIGSFSLSRPYTVP